LLNYGQILISPSRTLSLGVLSSGGFLAGIACWGAFTTTLEGAHTETFCVSCHEMRNNVFGELKTTIPLFEPLGRACTARPRERLRP
jgi:nitrate/TMAO reductase-like tetraheme cytochrome c subunit